MCDYRVPNVGLPFVVGYSIEIPVNQWTLQDEASSRALDDLAITHVARKMLVYGFNGKLLELGEYKTHLPYH